MTDSPKVSILVSCYNHAPYIQACLQSILDQTYKNIELIVIDDGSSDNSFELIKPLADKYGFYAEKQANMGLSRTLNKMLAMATGKYICQFGSDDIMTPDKTARQVAFMESHPEVAVCGGNARFIDSAGHPVHKRQRTLPRRDVTFDKLFLREKNAGIPASSAMMRREVLDEAGGWNPAIPLEDMYLWLKITSCGHSMVGLEDVLLDYRKHDNNTYKNYRHMYQSLKATIAEYSAHPRYREALVSMRTSYFLAAAKHDRGLAREILSEIPLQDFNRRVVRGIFYMLAWPIIVWLQDHLRRSDSAPPPRQAPTRPSGRPTVRHRNIFGQWVTLFEGDYITKKILRHGVYEGPTLEFIDGLLRKMEAPVVLDIGANIGNHSLSFARAAHRVYSFEPVKNTFALLSENVRQNNLAEKITPFNFGLSDKNGKAEIFIIGGNVGASSVERRVGGIESGSEIITLRQGDEVARELGLTKIDFMKIDVEGHELHALNGLAGSIRRFMPIITMEWNDPAAIERINEAQLFSSLMGDYQVFVLGNNFDAEFWEGKPLAALRRRLNLLFVKKRARLYPFDASRVYHNILLVPKNKTHLLPA